jgi:UrcA family protein
MFHIVLLALAQVPSGADAVPLSDGSAPQVRVVHADLDLATRSGRRAFDARLAHAASIVCPHLGIRLAEVTARDRCLRTVRARIAPQRAAAIANYRLRRHPEVVASGR